MMTHFKDKYTCVIWPQCIDGQNLNHILCLYIWEEILNHTYGLDQNTINIIAHYASTCITFLSLKRDNGLWINCSKVNCSEPLKSQIFCESSGPWKIYSILWDPTCHHETWCLIYRCYSKSIDALKASMSVFVVGTASVLQVTLKPPSYEGTSKSCTIQNNTCMGDSAR